MNIQKACVRASLGLGFFIATIVPSIARAADVTPPWVSAVSPTTVTVNVASEFIASYSDETQITICTFSFDGGGPGTAYLNGSTSGWAMFPTTFNSVGTHTVQARCYDGTNYTDGPLTNIEVVAPPDMQSPVVGAILPATATVGVPVTLAASYSDAVGVTQCHYAYGGAPYSAMIGGATAGSATYQHTFENPGTFTLQVQCRDAAGNWGYGASTNVVVTQGADVVAPTLGAISPTTATVGTPVNLAASYSDAVGITQCQLVSGATPYAVTFGGPFSGTVTRSHTFSTAGTFAFQMQCRDAAGNWGYGAMTNIVVGSAGVTDGQSPVVGPQNPFTVPVNGSAVVQVAVSDNMGVTMCQLVEGATVYSVSLSGGQAISQSIAGTGAAGTRSFQMQCRDAAGNWGYSPLVSVSWSTLVGPDVYAPVVGEVQPSNYLRNVSYTVTAPYSDVVGVTACELWVGGASMGSMTIGSPTSGTASRSQTFGGGSHQLQVRCRDAAGNWGYSSMRTLTEVVGSPAPVPVLGGAMTVAGVTIPYGSLLKVSCPEYTAASDHPCKAVYYLSSQGKRHAFPSERVFYGWYQNFNTVLTISDIAMSQIPLGKNVGYRPGTRLVKFQSVPKVYAVGRYGILRWVTTESVAIGMYGSSWNYQVDDIPEAFYANYTFGADITATNQFSPSQEQANVTTIDQNM